MKPYAYTIEEMCSPYVWDKPEFQQKLYFKPKHAEDAIQKKRVSVSFVNWRWDQNQVMSSEQRRRDYYRIIPIYTEPHPNLFLYGYVFEVRDKPGRKWKKDYILNRKIYNDKESIDEAYKQISSKKLSSFDIRRVAVFRKITDDIRTISAYEMHVTCNSMNVERII